ncbi:TolB protein [Mariprofundus erugo]|uniref:TolB family protein n=1 Tax=Mariprofundus erugo TaxID=2528639 RepID=UPI0010FD0A21|nr:PD40 domain-containing protein [Mariprofundus erugo]TLS77346.1 TolB protein [Mariprofundus erugo]
MRYSIPAAIGLALSALFTTPASAASILDWMQEHRPATSGKPQDQPADSATLLTLEPDETEMYPHPSADGRFLLTLTGNHHRGGPWISRRYSENGDPANVVSDDPGAIDSTTWMDPHTVCFLSEKTGELGLWEKSADGEGMQRRIQALTGLISQPLLLKDGRTIIAVRLKPADKKNSHRQTRERDYFNNWSFDDASSEIVRFNSDGSEQVLSQGMNPSLSPDGNWIAFAMPVGRSMHLFRVHPDGTELIQLTDSRSSDVQPSWSPDGQWLLFTSDRTAPDLRHADKGAWDIWSIDINGRNLAQVTRDPARDGGAWMGSDGRIYFHSDRKIDKATLAQHQLKSASAGFHIWSINWQQPDTTGTSSDK